MPGDPFDYTASGSGEDVAVVYTQEQKELLREYYGLDKPWPQQLVDTMVRNLHGDLGQSIHYKRPVADLLLERLPWSLWMMGASLLLSLLLGVCCIIRFLLLYHTIKKEDYLVLEGVCLKREKSPLSRSQEILFRTVDGKEYRFRLEKQTRGKLTCVLFENDPYNGVCAFDERAALLLFAAAAYVPVLEPGPLALRSQLVPVVQFASSSAMWVIMLGLVILATTRNELLCWIGIGMIGVSALFSIITLPVEYNASARALEWLQVSRTMGEAQLSQAREALSWAARTYLVAALSAIASVLYYVLLILGGRRD